MKKFLTLFFALVLALSCIGLVACGGGNDNTPEETTYTITFMSEGEVYKTQQVTSGKFVNKPTAPTPKDENTEFAAWYKDAAFTEEFKFAAEKPTSDMTLYAKFVAKEAALTVEFFNGEERVDSKELKGTASITLDAVTGGKGEVFVGWAFDKDATAADKKAGDTLTKAEVEDKAYDNVVKMYAVFTKADVVAAVWERYFLAENETFLTAIKTDYSAANASVLVEYRVYDDTNYHDVATFGAAINEDGDVDIILGSGANIVTTGKVEGIVTRANMIEKYKAGNRQAALLDKDNASAVNMYKMLTGLSDNTAKITLSYGETPVTGTVSELFGDNLEYTLPEKENATFIGWATTADATEAAIDSATALTYEAVKDLLAEGEVTLYPVFENVTYDLVVYVYLGNSSKTYITEEESAAMKAAFEATHSDKKIKWENISGVAVDGFATSAIGGGADVVIAGKAMGDLTVITDAETNGNKTLTGAGWCENTSRYVAVVSGHETNNLAIELWTLISTAKA